MRGILPLCLPLLHALVYALCASLHAQAKVGAEHLPRYLPGHIMEILVQYRRARCLYGTFFWEELHSLAYDWNKDMSLTFVSDRGKVFEELVGKQESLEVWDRDFREFTSELQVRGKFTSCF